eukprot:CAMPEP_0114340302 /NCGR_PEP_ID=MMETSP0101-20121206/8292_1 /TAXON_ID=38822 ORGANISM="Pteridomonas danica, Strain PT" /NCGR_SAMPLE_ID=MMETSP0101 /ASSEMBLY_ACC=CAM_ASM_000211 /LENGTH=697 /DNA_ID=CAMNT_0001473531 /DNA_START=215 /DNA_END=2308 /DNA_ORIENTATION=-
MSNIQRIDEDFAAENSVSDAAIRRGVRVDWLVSFTNEHDCWDWPTYRVVRDIVKPATEKRQRVRYSDLSEVQPFTGIASVFASHCWGAPWGTLVSALAYQAPSSRFIWLDCFSVRQWPGNNMDLDFRSVISLSSTLMAVIHVHDDIHTLSASSLDLGEVSIPIHIRPLINCFRIWCLAELGAAKEYHKQIIFRAGKSVLYPREKNEDDDGASSCIHKFEGDADALDILKFGVDCREASATIDSDRVRILNEIENSPGGCEALNASIVLSMEGGRIATSFGPLIQGPIENASCGEPLQLIDSGLLNNDLLSPALMAASAGGHIDAIHILIDRGANVCWEDNTGTTPLWRASYQGLISIVLLLIQNGANSSIDVAPYDTNGDVLTPLSIAVHGGHIEVVKLLLTNGANPDGIPNTHRFEANITPVTPAVHNTPLWLASLHGHVEIAHLLIKAGATIDRLGADGTSPFLIACGKGRELVVNLLLDAGVNPNNIEKDRFPLLVSVFNGNLNIFRALLEHGALITQSNSNGINAIYASVCSNKIEFVKYILDWCQNHHDITLDINTKISEGRTVLWEASLNGFNEIISLLIEGAEADVDIPDASNGIAPITVATLRSHITSMGLLLQAGAKVHDVESPAGLTPLIAAVSTGNVEVVKVLMNAGADPKALNCNGVSALQQAKDEEEVAILEIFSSGCQSPTNI